MIYLFVFLIGAAIGCAATMFIIARDSDLVRLLPDEVVMKKPSDGLILVAVTAEIARKLIMRKPSEDSTQEARKLYRDTF